MKKCFNNLACTLLAFVLLSGCGVKTENTDEKESEPITEERIEATDLSHISIAYDSTDSLNPYYLKSVSNKYISELLYDSLVKLDTSFEPIKCAAEEITISDKTVVIKLKSGLKFADGTDITSADLKYSLDMARGEGSPYSYSLKNVDSAIETDSLTLTVYLTISDVNFKNVLTFPIIKNGQGLERIPTPSGRYIINANELTQNPLSRKKSGKVKKISLVEIDQKETIMYSIQKNIIDLYFSMESNYASGAVPITYNNVNMNRLVYLGVNNISGYMANSNFKKAIDLAIDREAINSYVFSSAGLTANTLFNPDFYDNGEQRKTSVIDSAKLLDGIGLNKINSDGWRIDRNTKISLNLLVNSENVDRMSIAQIIKKQLLDVGIQVNIDAQPFENYKLKLSSNDFDMYIAEIGIADNMDFSLLLTPNDNAGFGTVPGNVLQTEFMNFKMGSITAEEFTQKFEENPSFLPLLYRNGILVYSKNIDADIVSTKQDIFFNIDMW